MAGLMMSYRKYIFIAAYMLSLVITASARAEVLFLIDDKNKYNLSPFIEILEDPGQKFTINEVSSHRFKQRFKTYKKKYLSLKSDTAVYWIRFTIAEAEVSSGKGLTRLFWLLDIGRLDSAQAKLFFIREHGGKNVWVQETPEELMVSNSIKPTNPLLVFRLPMNLAKPKTCYLRVQGHKGYIPLTISSDNYYSIRKEIRKMLLGIFYGIILAIAFYNLFLFFALKDKSDLWYILHITSLGIFLLSFNTLTQEYYLDYFENFEQARGSLNILTASIMFMFASQFLRAFFQFNEHSKIFDKIILIYAVLWGFCAISPLVLPFSYQWLFFLVLVLICPVTILGAAYVAWKHHTRSAGLFFLGWASFAVGFMVFNIMSLEYLSVNVLTHHSFQLGALMEAGLLSLAMADRFRVLRLKKEKAEKDIRMINQELEHRVEERTADLREAERKYRNIFENAPVGIFQSDPDGVLLSANPEYPRIFGFQSIAELMRQVTSLSNWSFTDAQSRKKFMNILRNEGELHNFELQAKRKDHSDAWISINARGISDDKNELVQIDGFINDITERKRAEEELARAKEAAETATKAKSEFLANMSHEIRTPMNAILGFTEILERKISDEDQIQNLEAISASGRTLLRLINDILDLSKIEAGRMEFEYEAVNPHAIFRELQQTFSWKMQEKGLDFIVNIDPELPNSLVLDGIRIRQILLNLMGNAVKFTDEGSITLSVKKNFTKKDKSKIDLVFSVADTGIGIPETQKALIFEAFKQQTGQKAAKYGGTGLGLTITRRLVEMMGGEISVESEVNRGSDFKVKLRDVAVASLSDETPEDQQEFDVESIKFDKGTVLVVDDIATNRSLIKGYLGADLNVLEAENGREAVECASIYKPDLILMDMKMPVMDGYEATEKIKTDEALKDITIVALTASAMKSSVNKIMGTGVDGYLRKPVSLYQLVSELMKFLPYKVLESTGEKAAGKPKDTGKKSEAPMKISKEALENIPELLEKLNEEYIPRLEELQNTMIMSDLEDFGDDMIRLGDQYKIEKLHHWAEMFLRQVQNFDMENLPKTIANFSKLKNALNKYYEVNKHQSA